LPKISDHIDFSERGLMKSDKIALLEGLEHIDALCAKNRFPYPKFPDC
jgi:hypothetical protein